MTATPACSENRGDRSPTQNLPDFQRAGIEISSSLKQDRHKLTLRTALHSHLPDRQCSRKRPTEPLPCYPFSPNWMYGECHGYHLSSLSRSTCSPVPSQAVRSRRKALRARSLPLQL